MAAWFKHGALCCKTIPRAGRIAHMCSIAGAAFLYAAGHGPPPRNKWDGRWLGSGGHPHRQG